MLGTKSLVKQIWSETEPFGLTLQSAPNCIWTPQPRGLGNTSLIDVALQNYNAEQAKMINRYRLILQLISICDLLTYDLTQIHPDLLAGNRVSSRKSTIYWVNFPRPPKKG